MGIGQRLCYLAAEDQRLPGRKSTALLERISKRPPRTELHHDANRFSFPKLVIDLNDVRVIQGRHGFRFPEVPLKALGFIIVSDDLENHTSAEGFLERKVDASHSSGP